MGSDKPDYTIGISILEQALANLTAVVSASALDIRALDNADKPFIGLPYNTLTHEKTDVDLADTDLVSLDLTSADWGVGFDWVTYALVFSVKNATTEFMTKRDEGFSIHLSNVGTDLAFAQNFNAGKFRPLKISNDYWLKETFFIPFGFYTLEAQTLRLSFRNYTGVTLDFINVYFIGVGVEK